MASGLQRWRHIGQRDERGEVEFTKIDETIERRAADVLALGRGAVRYQTVMQALDLIKRAVMLDTYSVEAAP